MKCEYLPFNDAFKKAADWYRLAGKFLDTTYIKAFDTQDYPLAKAGLLLADKYRSGIDYPITHDEPAEWQQAMFADWSISYARDKNLGQPDLGEYVINASQVVNGENANYAHPPLIQESKTFSVYNSGQWTTTGWYALPGQKITLTRTDNSAAKTSIKLNYHRDKTNKVYTTGVYKGPIELNQNRLSIQSGETITFSTPYGGPIYLSLSGSSPVQATLTISGATRHPAITDFNNEQQIETFIDLFENTEIPHVDLRSEQAEQHMRRDKFTASSTPDDIKTLLTRIKEDHVNTVYTLAGFRIQGKTLNESLPEEVVSVCRNLFGDEDCFDETLHNRTTIQHANYDQNAQCGGGCAGNPWDASWSISPRGWGDNHELGHNLQTRRLNVHYTDNKDNWPSYGSRAGENSNNMFPYYVRWKAHYLTDGNSDPITDVHANQKELFYVFMSDALQLKDSAGNKVVVNGSCKIIPDGDDRYTAPWSSNEYAIHNGYRMTYYLQMALRADKQVMSEDTILENGYNIWTLLYLHHRIFGRYAKQDKWELNRARLGFSEFDFDGDTTYGGNKVSNMPGNDFMLVSLGLITNKDWRPYFDMFGLKYSDLASKQVVTNQPDGVIEPGMFVLEQDLPPKGISKGLEFISMSLDTPDTVWPRNNKSPADCDI